MLQMNFRFCLLSFCLPSMLLAAPVFFDDFEDGDYTLDPIWEQIGTYHWQEIVDSPTESGNKVLRMHGTEEGGSWLAASVAGEATINNFVLTYDFYAPSLDFTPRPKILGSDCSIMMGLHADLSRDGDIFRFDARISGNGLASIIYPASVFDVGKWYRVTCYYDIERNCVVQELSNRDSGVFGFAAIHPLGDIPINPNASIEGFVIGCEETSWQYFDNISIVPEPISLWLMLAGSASIFRFRKKKMRRC